jgi:DNA repair photolyase
MIGITERGDAALNYEWLPWVQKRKPAILITKDVGKLAAVLEENFLCSFENIIVHATITGMGGSSLEPHVPLLKVSVAGLEHLLTFLRKENVVIRIDPIFPDETGLRYAIRVWELTKRFGVQRYRISFLDAYPHVRDRFKAIGTKIHWEGVHAPLEERKAFLERMPMQVEVCGEPGLPCHGCLSATDLKLLGVKSDITASGVQRPACACLALKKELLNNKTRCPHGCLYCYWQD